MEHQPPDQHADWGHPCAAFRKATAEHVIGGNNKGASTTLTGNTNVTVKDNAIVAGAIIGGSTSAHNAVTTITGNTSVLVTNVQYSNTAQNLDRGLSNSYIIGGSSWSSNTTSGTTIQGSTSATINLNGITLSGTEEHNSFVKTIIGGSYGNVNNAGTVNNINGDTSVSIIGREGITFTGDIIGGSFEIQARPNTRLEENPPSPLAEAPPSPATSTVAPTPKCQETQAAP